MSEYQYFIYRSRDKRLNGHVKRTNLVPSSVCFSKCCRFWCFAVLRHLFTCDPILQMCLMSCTDLASNHILSFSLHPSLCSVVATSHSHVLRVQVAADADSLKAIKCKYQSWLVNCNLSASITLARVNNPYKWFWEPTWNPKKGQLLNPWMPWDYRRCLHMRYVRIAQMETSMSELVHYKYMRFNTN